MSISKSLGVTINNFDTNKGIITLMYHRFEENKYPSTNTRNENFKEQIKAIENSGIDFIDFEHFEKTITTKIDKNYLLLTIDDAYESFYLNAWPILKKKNIPFLLFVSTREVGKHGYMTWDQINEIDKSHLGTIGNHSHSHDYMVDWEDKEIKKDIDKSIAIFQNELGYSPKFFSYPFGEYSNNFKKIILDLKFKFAFGQHSGVIDITKDFFELPRFPINEKYGELKRFKSILKTLPFPYKNITPENKYIKFDTNPPNVEITFFNNLINTENTTCYSNEGNTWKKSNIKFIEKNKLRILLKEKFESERGRINCSLLEKNGKWRWLGIQFVIAEN